MRTRSLVSLRERGLGVTPSAASWSIRFEAGRQVPVEHEYSASRSSRVERDVDELGSGLAVLETIGDHTEREGLDFRLGLRRRLTVSEDSRQFGHFSEPPPVVLLLDVNPELHGPILLPPYRSP